MLSKRKIVAVLGVVVLHALVFPTPALAQATRTWVSGVGDDVNPCSRTAPCKTFAGAISKTAAKGEINCLDSGGFGALTITKSISVNCRGVIAGVLTNASNAININAGVNDVVILRGLDINGLGTASNGIRVTSAKRVKVYDTEIYGFATSGFSFAPSNANAKALLKDVTIEDITGNGVVVVPTGSNARVTVRNSTIVGNGCGVVVTSFTTTAADNCGFATTGTAAGSASANIFDSEIIDNDTTTGATGSTGVFTNGGTAVARIGGNLITGNTHGIRAVNPGFGGIFSFGDNSINGNATNGTPNGTVPLT